MDGFEVVEELEEHHPGEQRQAIHVAIQALVLAQDLACGADQGGQIVARGQRCFGFAGQARILFGCDGFGGWLWP
jgi:CheY-like chemotaxis protein